jgi:hypothetical protein
MVLQGRVIILSCKGESNYTELKAHLVSVLITCVVAWGDMGILGSEGYMNH